MIYIQAMKTPECWPPSSVVLSWSAFLCKRHLMHLTSWCAYKQTDRHYQVHYMYLPAWRGLQHRLTYTKGVHSFWYFLNANLFVVGTLKFQLDLNAYTMVYAFRLIAVKMCTCMSRQKDLHSWSTWMKYVTQRGQKCIRSVLLKCTSQKPQVYSYDTLQMDRCGTRCS